MSCHYYCQPNLCAIGVRTRTKDSNDDRATWEPVLYGHDYLQGSFKPKQLGGAMAVAAVILGPCPRIFFSCKFAAMPGSGIEPLVHFPGCHVMGSLRPISISHHPQPKSPAVRYDARRPRSRQFWNALVGGERYYQAISSLFSWSRRQNSAAPADDIALRRLRRAKVPWCCQGVLKPVLDLLAR